MGRYFALSLQVPRETKTKSKYKLNFNVRKMFSSKFSAFILFTALVLSVMYLIQANSVSTKGYEIEQLEQQMVELKESNKRLQIEAASLKSIQNIDEDIQAMNLVPSTNVQHLPETDFALSSQ